MKWKINEHRYERRLQSSVLYKVAGKITSAGTLLYESILPEAGVGSLCKIIPDPSQQDMVIDAEVIGFQGKKVFLAPLEESYAIQKGSLVVLEQKFSLMPVSEALLGRVINGKGKPLDGGGDIFLSKAKSEWRPLYKTSMNPLKRTLIRDPLDVGVRSINGLLSIGRGQKVGIFAGSGVGKSVLLGMMSRGTNADVVVLALIGERGREVREFLENVLGEDGRKKSVVVVSTSEESALMRIRAAYYAASIAEYFQEKGKNVLFLMDSLTRLSMAQREIGLSLGEPPATKGYPPSVFSMMPKLLERVAVSTDFGSITSFVTVLVEGDEMDDPIADAARSILDGHIVLSRKLANIGQYPAIDVLQSRSRVMKQIVSKEHFSYAMHVLKWLGTYEEVEDLVKIGAYVKGSQPDVDEALEKLPQIRSFLSQDLNEKVDFQSSFFHLRALALGKN